MNLDLARGMMAFGADLLKYRCPGDLPELRIEPEEEHNVPRGEVVKQQASWLVREVARNSFVPCHN
ncbi:hypothetical protein LJR231_004216 [Phyllobacterium sp. LjRoot231]|uniref:hypothetical protein n=1 Tax=Phyllobacterium sp. LjRoot231 TaxID=3342289 RepID=UPI003ECD3B58